MRLLLVLALLFASPIVAGSHTPVGRCDGSGLALGLLQLGGGTAESTFYVDDRNFLLGNGVWLYHESNGIFDGRPPSVRIPPQVFDWWDNIDMGDGDAHHNLQRGGDSLVVPDSNEICVDDPSVTPDTLLN